jgi:hypothetical protein
LGFLRIIEDRITFVTHYHDAWGNDSLAWPRDTEAAVCQGKRELVWAESR